MDIVLGGFSFFGRGVLLVLGINSFALPLFVSFEDDYVVVAILFLNILLLKDKGEFKNESS